MKKKIHGQLALATLLGLAAAGSASAEPGDKYPAWGFFGGGQQFVPFDLGGNLDDFATDSVVGEDGSLYIAGTVRDAQGLRRIGIAKLDPDGVLDNTFSGDGKHTSFLTNVTATAIALTETKIYVAGFTTNNAPDFNMVVCRFLRSNGFNNNFPDNGNSNCVSPDSFDGTQDIARDIVVLPDGKFVIAGTMGINNAADRYAAFARFNSDGSRDTTFGTIPGSNLRLVRTNGVYVAHDINALARASNGKLIGVGSTTFVGDNGLSALVIRLNEDGTSASEFAFARDGSATRDTVLRDVVAVDDPNNTDDALLVAGLVELTGGKNSGFIAKVAAGGGALETFGEDPGNITAITLAGATNLDFTDLAVEPDGSIVTLGLRSPDGAGDDLLVRRFTANGGIDAIFGNNGNVIIDLGFAGEFHGPAAINALGDGLYISGWAARNADTTNLDFIAAKLVSGSLPDFFANGFKDSFED